MVWSEVPCPGLLVPGRKCLALRRIAARPTHLEGGGIRVGLIDLCGGTSAWGVDKGLWEQGRGRIGGWQMASTAGQALKPKADS